MIVIESIQMIDSERGALMVLDGHVQRTGEKAIRAYQDNVIIVLEPPPAETASGIAIVHTRGPGAREHRTARVIASGPGYHTRLGALVPNTVKNGDRVVVDALAGQNYAFDLTVPRHNKNAEFQELFGDKGEWRIIREAEILGVIEDETRVAAE